MCVTAFAASLSKTRICLAQAANGRRGLWYQMNYQDGGDLAGTRSVEEHLPVAWRPKSTSGQRYRNFMVLPIFGEQGSIEVLETKTARYALAEMEAALPPPSSNAWGMTAFSVGGGSALLVETEDFTTIVAAAPSDIDAALTRHNIVLNGPGGRTDFKPILDAYGRAYPAVPIALVLIKATSSSGTVLITYEPLPQFNGILVAPGLDGHGELDLKAPADRDHCVMLGCPADKGSLVDYDKTEIAPEILPYLPDAVIGCMVDTPTPNGDFLFDLADVQQGILDGRLALPFGYDDAEGDPNINRWRLTSDGADMA